jgi:subfamily B ATP-binding cassette protein MsbA
MLLSGGQKQRIGIARAFLKNAPILVLDEATSALDNQAEHIVQQAIENLMKDRTVFVIAHRLSTIQNADKILVIKNGNLVESGSHNELMEIPNGEYKKLYEMQFQL